jgi:hypothetical protein
MKVDFQEFIYKELKDKKKSFDLLVRTVFKIVEDVIRSWKVVNTNTYI